jgi:hypothetical protein
MKKLLISLSFVVLAAGLTAQTTYTWIGADGQGGDGDWGVAANWSPTPPSQTIGTITTGGPHSNVPATDPKVTVIINTSPTLSPKIRMTHDKAVIHKMKVTGGGAVTISSDVSIHNYRVIVRDSLTFEGGTKINLTGNASAADGKNGAGLRFLCGDGTKFKFKGHDANNSFTSSDGYGWISTGVQDSLGITSPSQYQQLYLDPNVTWYAVQVHKGLILLKTNVTAKSVVFANAQGGYPPVLKLDNNVQLTITNEVASNVRNTFGEGNAAIGSVNASAPGSKVIIKEGAAATFTGAQSIISGTQTLFFPNSATIGGTTVAYPGGINELELDMGALTFVPNCGNPVKNLFLKSGTLNNYTSGKILDIDEDTGILNIGGGATYDISGRATYTEYGTAMSASGAAAPAIIKGGTTVNLRNIPISLTFSPVTFDGDLTRPALTVSQGALTLSNNTINVNNASGTALGNGTYRLITVTGGTTTGTPKAAVTVTGSGLVAGASAIIEKNGADINLVVSGGTTTGNTSLAGNNVSAYVNSANQLVINAPEKSNYTVFNMIGASIETGIVTSSGQLVSNSVLQPGVYIVNVNNVSNKIIVR